VCLRVCAVAGPSGAAAIVKQALPYVRAVGESFPLSRVSEAQERYLLTLILSPLGPLAHPMTLAVPSDFSVCVHVCLHSLVWVALSQPF
jgi:hypothetical protein